MPRRAALSALIIAGGRGTRLWPASRERQPKPLFSADGKRSLLEATIARLSPTVARERIFVLVAAAQATAFRRALRGLIPARNLIVEPAARGTAVAIAYGMAAIERRAGAGVVAVMPADHIIEPAAGLRATIAAAAALASSRHALVVIGIAPTRPETGFGYQKIGAAIGAGFKVEQFIEKPPLARARRMVRSGKYLWNAGMFVMDSRTLEAELRAHSPALASAAKALVAMPRAKFERAYKRLKFESFDREVVERSRNVVGVRARFRWHDVGSWEGLRQAVGGGDGASVTRGHVLALDSERIVAHSDTRLMVIFGVSDVIAIDTGDAILITHRNQSDAIRRVTDALATRGLHKYL
ncbi:MAG TPA: sugar phosphate nucleotidyltransferase [Candidatus Binataceae bacterium]|nr:sugar phosphate nucleotidyltransferase [Candidatus Binataceae bacterium]